ncbi:hypothetical protein [uncultured Winogradskyella sp.]|uniref:hypothetical protein n=1 Tax=uncultured Winogradskyella sp. TaxID=395353 RepID=UPI002632AB3E|nr:hypothetical protein [uncultured Winogradskyella sp.]
MTTLDDVISFLNNSKRITDLEAVSQGGNGMLFYLYSPTLNKILKFDWENLPKPTKNNDTATTNPTSTNDTSEGYSILSLWVNTTDNTSFICIDNTENQAVWQAIKEEVGLPSVEKYGVSTTNTANENYIALAAAVAENDSLTVNGFYDIDKLGEDVIELSANFKLLGNTKDAGFNIVNSSNLFNGATVGNTFELDNIKITYTSDPTATESRIFSILSGDYYQNVTIKNCNISGHTRVIHCVSGDFDPETTNFGIKNIKVINNNFEDVTGNVFFIRDSPSQEEVVENNKINNLQGTFYFSALDNSSTNVAAISDARVKVNIQNNTLTNDVSLIPNDVPATYFSLAVIESYNVLYNNNEVRGLKTLQTQAIYDAYLSCTNVTYTNNRWYNNVCFDTTDVVNNHLIKSKDNNSTTYNNPTRIYKNNIWVIESDFLTAVSKTSSDTWNNFYEIAANSDFIFENNTIDIYGLVPNSSAQITNKISIRNNDFTFDYIKQVGSLFSFNYNNQYDTDSFLNNNNITIKSDPLTVESSFLTLGNSIKWLNKLQINNNTLLCENPSIKYFIENILCENLELTGNSINGQLQALFYDLKTDIINSYNNNYRTTLSGNYFFADRGDFVLKEGIFKLTSLNSGDIRFGVNNNPTAETWYKYTFTFEDSDSVDKFYLKFRVYDDSGTIKINFFNEAGSEIDMQISTGTGNEFMKLNRLSQTSKGTKMLYINHATIPRITSSLEPSTQMLKTIELEVYQGTGSLTEQTDFVKVPEYTFSNLPTGIQSGTVAAITDASSPTYGATASGGGSTYAKVTYNGTNWIY